MKAVHAVGACATIKLEYMEYSEFQNSYPKWQMHMAKGATYILANGMTLGMRDLIDYGD